MERTQTPRASQRIRAGTPRRSVSLCCNPASSRRRQHNKAARFSWYQFRIDMSISGKRSRHSSSVTYTTSRKMSRTTIESKRTADAQQRKADTQPQGPEEKPTGRVLNTRGARVNMRQRSGVPHSIE